MCYCSLALIAGGRIVLRRALVLLLVAIPNICSAQGKIPVEIEHTGDDQVGKLYVFELKEAIRGSQSMRIVGESGYPARIRVMLVSLDSDTPDQGRRSAISVTILYDALDIPLSGAYLSSTIQLCGRDRATACARSTMAKIDAQAEYLKTKSPAFWKALNAGNQ